MNNIANGNNEALKWLFVMQTTSPIQQRNLKILFIHQQTTENPEENI